MYTFLRTGDVDSVLGAGRDRKVDMGGSVPMVAVGKDMVPGNIDKG